MHSRERVRRHTGNKPKFCWLSAWEIFMELDYVAIRFIFLTVLKPKEKSERLRTILVYLWRLRYKHNTCALIFVARLLTGAFITCSARFKVEILFLWILGMIRVFLLWSHKDRKVTFISIGHSFQLLQSENFYIKALYLVMQVCTEKQKQEGTSSLQAK